MTDLAFVDCETTGLDPERHDVWEIGLIVDEKRYEWLLNPPLASADPNALRLSRFYERSEERNAAWLSQEDNARQIASNVAHLTANRHLVGVNPAFDAGFLTAFLGADGLVPAWHYHLIDVSVLAIGYLWRKVAENREAGYDDSIEPTLPWKSNDISLAVGVDPDDFDRHTALGDALWAKAIYEAVTS